MSERLGVVSAAIRCALGIGSRRDISPEARLREAITLNPLRDPDMQRALDEYLSREHNPEREHQDRIRLLRWARSILPKS
ncbi:Uncharacterised protein [Mycobacteroides abscessus subsp. massiliense]|uniref:hypothetical protein n=2 Tax=Mycobacteroides abscessus TaxID=36809 RepID=UPI000927EDDD|nr:hypothetical protein [Mycobacteroides abscessus]SIM41273.1 Uncharacterised protein [Mycobacteroides abscessus subsp. bolletii]MBE5405745.1 hypothetical protein [Mycobacteroides abscessus]MBE5429544.1 hypothetical protein [Mycobacteroides abscessus]MBE5498559.1 hypothetical protein [Mycobacteroides abscessus]MBN7466093.1 hypothetical protein [Mycobacteroides abscessus subsp. massiliense]